MSPSKVRDLWAATGSRDALDEASFKKGVQVAAGDIVQGRR